MAEEFTKGGLGGLEAGAHAHGHAHDHAHGHAHDHTHPHTHDHDHDHAHAHTHDHTHPHAHAHAHAPKSELVRFSVAMPEDLLASFDALVAKRGLAKNRSEVVRDLVRDALVKDETEIPGMEVMGTLTIVYNHHASDVQEKLHEIQHAYFSSIVSNTHVHLDEENCLEVIILRGETTDVHLIANRILGTKGVKTGGLVVTTTNQMI